MYSESGQEPKGATETMKSVKAVMLAGGKGTRLRPYTLVLPKPLMPVGDIPVIESLLKWLRRNGVRDVFITIGYLGHLIKALCGNGRQWDMNIAYSEEPEPMGTIGPLRLLIDKLKSTFLVLNGDLVTDLDLREFVKFHKRHGGILSVAVKKKSVKVDLGVLDSEAGVVTRFREKPQIQFNASMGIYCMEPQILNHIPEGIYFGFDDLMHTLLAAGEPIHVFDHEGVWMDIGREEDFFEAQKILRNEG
jgi:NDP-sugar pyrophosphorylase family protein